MTIDRRIRERGAVFVRRWGGVGRTGFVVGCWLQEHGRTPGATPGRRPGRVEPAAGRSLYSQVNGLTILDDLQNYEAEDGEIVEIDITRNPSANA